MKVGVKYNRWRHASCRDNQLQLVFGCMTSSGLTGNKQFPKSLSPSRFQEPPGCPCGSWFPPDDFQ